MEEITVPDEEIALDTRGVPSLGEIAGGLGSIVPLVFSSASYRLSRVDGKIVSLVYRDWAALLGGGLAVLMALLSFWMLGRTAPALRTRRVAVAAVLLLAGALHVARGVGLFFTPPA